MFRLKLFFSLSLNLSQRSPADGAARIIFLLQFSLPPYAAVWFESKEELQQTGTFEERSTDWATAQRLHWTDNYSSFPTNALKYDCFIYIHLIPNSFHDKSILK